ncbi:hypothetical protein OSB04_023998 [Centaurea solstitialis]|uniref:Uncharacterized protein n=1 Tax=Centaurea solstitialis TaxID=347529 RepID=A0AA38SYN2_9ASTR|nr:hypothetical protein OSB04_023998 [Centaurea solstitialis]
MYDTLMLERGRQEAACQTRNSSDKISQVRERLKTARDRQKSYADKYRTDIEFQVRDHVMLKIPYFLENGPHVPTQTVHPIPAAGGQPAIPERELVKPVTDWNDEDRRLVNIDTKARSLIAMSLPDDVFHSVCHLRSAKEIWDTL